jgi:hypothetical protein
MRVGLRHLQLHIEDTASLYTILNVGINLRNSFLSFMKFIQNFILWHKAEDFR